MIAATEKSAFLFSGTGTQKPGMGKDFYDEYAEFRRVYECAGDIFGFDVNKTAFEGTAEEISGTLVAHRLIYAFSMGVYAVVRSRLPAPMAFAGHSLGELAALTACGVFTEEQGFTALKWRSQYMDEAGRGLSGAMCAILGSNADAISAACVATGGFVLPVNYNAPSQTVISGDSDAVNAAIEILKASGAKAIPLNVTVPFHTIKLQEASERLRESLSTLVLSPKPAAKFFCNVTGSEMADFTGLSIYLAKQMISPVMFIDEVSAMHAVGVTEYIELGTSKVLTGLVKKIIKGSNTFNIDSTASLL